MKRRPKRLQNAQEGIVTTGIQWPLAPEAIKAHNDKHIDAVKQDYEALGRTLKRRGIDIDAIKKKVADFTVAVPSWGVGVGGTRFARFPIPKWQSPPGSGSIGGLGWEIVVPAGSLTPSRPAPGVGRHASERSVCSRRFEDH